MINKRLIYIFIPIACFFIPTIPIVAEEKKQAESSSDRLCQVLPKTDENEIITKNTISQTELTVPSLWWKQKQLDPEEKIIINWKAYTDDKIIDLIVDRQQWNFLDYIQRFNIVNNFGTVAKEYQYNLRTIDDRQVCLVTYSCKFSLNPERCEINFKFLGRGILERN